MSKVYLLVDDNFIDLMINEKTVERFDSEVEIHKAGSGSEALEMLISGKVKPDIVLLDIKMPIMNGFEFLHELESSKLPVNFKIHVLSSSIDPSDLQEAKDSPIVQSYIEKPLSVEKLNKIN